MAGDGLDFDALALVAVKHPVTLGGQTWQVRDDFPASVGLDMFLLFTMSREMRWMQKAAELQQDGAVPTVEAVEAAARKVAADYEAAMLDCCAAIFAHSYPDMTKGEVEETFSPTQREAICAYFFGQRMPSSPTPAGDGTTPTSADAPNPPATTAATSPTETTTKD